MSWILFLQLVLLIVIIALVVAFWIFMVYDSRRDFEKARYYQFKE